jgi:arylsulfatase A-like enzyme
MDKKPNVILLIIDSLRADHVGCINGLKTLTPNIDKLAERGVLFSQAISNGPCTVFSFPSIFTSCYALTYPIMLQFGGLPKPYLSSERETITELLKRNGYSTGAFVQPSPLIFHNYERGFDKFDYIDTVRGGFFRSIFKVRYILLKLLTPKNPLLNILQKVYGFFTSIKRQLALLFGNVPYRRASSINGKAINWLNTLERIPGTFFLWTHYMDPHQPYLPGKMTLMNRISAIRLNKKVYASAMKASPLKRREDLNEDEVKKIMKLYEKEVEYVDSEIGSFLTQLEQRGIDLKNSYIILTADHGEEFMEHGELEHHRKLYDELIHVPLIICGPGIRGNRVVQDQVSLIDIAPTLLDLLGYPPQNTFQGRSLLPLLKGQTVPKRATISEYMFSEDVTGFSYRTDEYKYILKLESGKRSSELYNLLQDPQEQYNLTGAEDLSNKYNIEIQNHMVEEQTMRKAIEYKEHLKEKIKSLKKMKNSSR